MLLLEFAREYQMPGLRVRCAEVFSGVIAKTPDGDLRLLDLLVVASEHCLTDRLEKLIPRVAQLKTAAIEQFHGKVDHGVLAAIYLAKSKKSEAILTSLPRPGTQPAVAQLHSLSSVLFSGYCSTCDNQGEPGRATLNMFQFPHCGFFKL